MIYAKKNAAISSTEFPMYTHAALCEKIRLCQQQKRCNNNQNVDYGSTII
jgi:hypothetical protein